MPYIVLISCLVIAIALQFLTGNFPVTFFAFPLNLIIAVLWLVIMVLLWKHKRKTLFVEFLLSRGATVTSITMFLLFSLIIGLTGIRSLAVSWVSVFILLYFQTVLLFVIFRGWREQTATGARLGSIRWRFLLNHFGILLAVASAFWGAPDSETLRVRAIPDVAVREAVRMDGKVVWLPYEVTLKEFALERYDNGVPSMYEAVASIGSEEVSLKVNKPYSSSFGEDIYLVGYDSAAGDDPGYCILQVVREPWKYSAAAGIVLMLIGALLLFAGGPRKRYGEDD